MSPRPRLRPSRLIAAAGVDAGLPERRAEDANDDGKLDLADLVFLLQHLFQSGAAPPAPYPDPGLDPTQDTLAC